MVTTSFTLHFDASVYAQVYSWSSFEVAKVAWVVYNVGFESQSDGREVGPVGCVRMNDL